MSRIDKCKNTGGEVGGKGIEITKNSRGVISGKSAV